ncbi:hypothetical protein QSH57_004212 [Fusarium oxysporum f. sp. vasinfectum]|nr:hypothetical protein QSH57_004212 [Fusarium oxysporum f. sp. vasinfectum]
MALSAWIYFFLTAVVSFFIIPGQSNNLASALPLSRRKEDDHSSTWQTLSDGTQDLAALLGLFATDSVERYAVDYSRGYLGAALSTCSMFGILGYVRALVKLSIGSEACVAAAFPTAPVRALLGVAPEDRLPDSELVDVKYVERAEGDNVITWKLVKTVTHTKESMPASWAYVAIGTTRRQPGFFLFEAGRSAFQHFSKQKPPRRWHVILAIILSAAVNSFLILSIGTNWKWYKYMASIGMFVVLASSSIMWAMVYMKEQLPLYGDDSSVFLDDNGEQHQRPCGSVTLRRENKNARFAFMEKDGIYVILPCTSPTQRSYKICRLFSGISAALITFGYLCQYIVVRTSTETESLRWLLSQGGLVLLRVLVWIFPTRLIPPFFDSRSAQFGHLARPAVSDFQSYSGTLLGSRLDSYRCFTELEIATAFASYGVGLDSFTMTTDVLKVLERINLLRAFKEAANPSDETIVTRTDILRSKFFQYEFNPLLFRKMLLQRSFDEQLGGIENSDQIISGDWTCWVLYGGHFEPFMLPLVKIYFQIEIMDQNNIVRSRSLESGWCTCFSNDSPGGNLVEVNTSRNNNSSSWLAFNKTYRCPVAFRYGTGLKFRLAYETGEAGDISIDSELTVTAYNKKWSSLRQILNQAASLQEEAEAQTLNRWFIQFSKESRLSSEDIHPESVTIVVPKG